VKEGIGGEVLGNREAGVRVLGFLQAFNAGGVGDRAEGSEASGLGLDRSAGFGDAVQCGPVALELRRP
jgi:hypothetical protein